MRNSKLAAGLKPPRQGRSQATLNRLAQAAQELLEERDWNEISVEELARHAQASVGSFYARFEDKDSLLDYLDRSHTREVALSKLSQTDSDDNLESIVRQLIASLVIYHRRYRGLIRTLALRGRVGKHGQQTTWDSRIPTNFRMALALLEQRRYEVQHLNPKRALSLAFSFALSAIRDCVLFPEPAGTKPISDEELIEEVSRATLGYLGVRTRRRGCFSRPSPE